MTPLLAILVGLVLLVGGAEALVRGASALALRLGLTPLVVGLTVVAFGTSSPELVVSTGAALEGRGAIAVGNIVGSNICNIGLILGLAALVRPMAVQSQLVRLDMPLLVVVSLLVPLVVVGGLGRVEGALLFVALLVYVWVIVRLARRDAAADVGPDAVPRTPKSLALQLVLIGGGLALLAAGADQLVDGAVQIAREWGISQRIIGLTLVAVGTSLPELATSMLAAFRGESDLAVGNVVGSNLFNVLGILGVASLAAPMPDAGVQPLDLAVMVVFALLLVPFARSGRVIDRKEGVVLLVLYATYVVVLATTGT